ncbi:MAG: hypothetical protein ING59_15840 [Burkholderiales bacterium]|nr:hypothetical protein [Burkholderiales bacterium]
MQKNAARGRDAVADAPATMANDPRQRAIRSAQPPPSGTLRLSFIIG